MYWLTIVELYSAPWLQRLVSWTLDFHVDSTRTNQQPKLTDEANEEVTKSLDKIRAMYIACAEDARPSNQVTLFLSPNLPGPVLKTMKRRTTIFFSPKLDSNGSALTPEEAAEASVDSYASREALLTSLPHNTISVMLELLVAVSGLLVREDYLRLGPLLWRHCLDLKDPKVVASVSVQWLCADVDLLMNFFFQQSCFLIMQCAEKVSPEFLQLLNADISKYVNFLSRLHCLD